MTVARTTLEGTVTRAGAPVGGAYVQLRDRNGDFTGELRTAEDGAYRFYIVAGRWTVVVMAGGGARLEREVDLASGDAAVLDLPLD
jgi:hypothetical protein